MDQREFPSKRDAWLAAVLWIGVAMMCVGAVTLLLRDVDRIRAVLLALLLLGTAVFILSLLYGTRYVLAGALLTIRSGPLRWRIDTASIRSVKPSTDPISSPACSLDRLEIAYGESKTVLISPDDRDGFLEELVRVQPALVRRDGELSRSPA